MENLKALLAVLKSLRLGWRIALLVAMLLALLSLSSCTRGFFMNLKGTEVDFTLRDTTVTKSMRH